MEKLQKKIRGYLNAATGYAGLMVILGLVLLFFPDLSLDLIRWSLAIILMVAGVAMLINDFRRQTAISLFSGSLLGVLLLVMGIIIVAHPDVLAIIPIILGAWMVVSSFFTLRLTVTLKNSSTSGFWATLVTSLIAIICGFVLIFHPISGAVAITSVLGAVIVVYAISAVVELSVFRHNLKEVARYFKEGFKALK